MEDCAWGLDGSVADVEGDMIVVRKWELFNGEFRYRKLFSKTKSRECRPQWWVRDLDQK